MKDVDGFREYAGSRLESWRRTAYLLCGDWHLADDLVSAALTGLYRHWNRVSRMDHPDAWSSSRCARTYGPPPGGARTGSPGRGPCCTRTTSASPARRRRIGGTAR